MLETKLPTPPRWRLHWRQSGTTAVEVALLAPIFFALIFGAIELSRLMFVFNTLQEVTRRAAVAAVNIDPRDTTAIAAAKQAAIFRSTSGELVLAPQVTDSNIRIDYLSLSRGLDGSLTPVAIPESSWPSNPAQNRRNCMANPNGSNCIRFVRVQVCDAASTTSCDAVKSTSSYILGSFPVNLPKATTITVAESMGYVPGMSP